MTTQGMLVLLHLFINGAVGTGCCLLFSCVISHRFLCYRNRHERFNLLLWHSTCSIL